MDDDEYDICYECGGYGDDYSFREFGCTRLAARISDLRKAGHAISRRTEKSYNRYGKPVWFAVYKLEASA